MYILWWVKYNTTHSVFLTWYQSHCSDLFLAVLSSLVWLPFLTTLPPSQLPPQPLTVEPPMSSSRHPWVPNLQPPSLRSFTLHRPLLFVSQLQILLRLRFWRYHWDHPAPIYTLVEASMPSETARASTRRSKLLFRWSRATRAPTRCSFLSRAVTRPHAPHAPQQYRWRHCWRQP